jgi:hypothetical protein
MKELFSGKDFLNGNCTVCIQDSLLAIPISESIAPFRELLWELCFSRLTMVSILAY